MASFDGRHTILLVYNCSCVGVMYLFKVIAACVKKGHDLHHTLFRGIWLLRLSVAYTSLHVQNWKCVAPPVWKIISKKK